jgi:hypothetical protein
VCRQRESVKLQRKEGLHLEESDGTSFALLGLTCRLGPPAATLPLSPPRPVARAAAIAGAGGCPKTQASPDSSCHNSESDVQSLIPQFKFPGRAGGHRASGPGRSAAAESPAGASLRSESGWHSGAAGHSVWQWPEAGPRLVVSATDSLSMRPLPPVSVLRYYLLVTYW